MQKNHSDCERGAGDKWIATFLEHLGTARGASVYTQRNYRQALIEFHDWQREQREQSPCWDKLQRDDFRAYLRFLGRHDLGRAAIHLRFSALRTFYKFLIRQGAVAASPIKNLSLPQVAKRLPKFLTVQQMEELLAAPGKLLPTEQVDLAADDEQIHITRRDTAILETIYSCGLRISELCGLVAADIEWSSRS